MLIRIPLDSEGKLDRILELEGDLADSGLEIETGFSIEEGIREWDIEARREETARVLQMLREAGFKPEIIAQKAPRRKRVKYKEGDVFRIPLADGRFAYGRIQAIEPPRPIFVEIYPIASQMDPPMAELAHSEWLLRIYCADEGITSGTWKIVGHLPILGSVQKPLFWDDSPFDGKFYLREDPVVALGQRETTLEEIARLRAQPAVLASQLSIETALNQVLVQGLKHEWFHPEESRNPVRMRPGGPR